MRTNIKRLAARKCGAERAPRKVIKNAIIAFDIPAEQLVLRVFTRGCGPRDQPKPSCSLSQLSVDCRTYRHTHCDNALLISCPDPPFPHRWMYFRSPARGIGYLMISTHNLLNRMGLGRLEPPPLSEPVATAARNMMNIITMMANFDSILQVNSVLTTSDTFAA